MTNVLKEYFILIVCIIIAGRSEAQNTNFNFSQSNFSNWHPALGQRGNCCVHPVTGGNSHTIISAISNDPVIGSALPRIPSGVTHVARLGSPAGGTYQEGGLTYPAGWKMNYDITVDTLNPILHYQVAVVGDGSHSCGDLAHTLPLNSIFRTRITDQNGNLLSHDECSEYEIQACSGGNMTMSSGWNTSTYFPWASVGIDLRPYAGQTVNIEFTFYACYYWGYHGNSYAYIAPDLITETDTVYFCKGSTTLEIEGLPRFHSYSWSNGDLTQNAMIVPPVDQAVYTCTYTSFNGCTMTRRYVLKEDPIQAAFSYMGCNEITFTDSTHLSPVSEWRWSFDDPSSGIDDTSFIQNPIHLFSHTGTYQVKLVATSSIGCKDSIVHSVPIMNTQADFHFNTATCLHDTTYFTDASTGMVNVWEWDFGDNSPKESIQSPDHMYASSGTYEVSLKITNPLGCEKSTLKEVTIHPLPVSQFNIPASVCHLTPFVPVDQSSIVVPSQIQYWSWDFGDGSSLVNTQEASHSYDTTGLYTISLITTSTHGCVDTMEKSVWVAPIPTADFSLDRDSGCFPLCIQATNNSSISEGTIHSNVWTSGGMVIGNVRDLSWCSHTSGLLPVTLQVESDKGCEAMLSKNIDVYAGPVAGFSVDPDPASLADPTITFTNLSSGAVSFVWNFGDNTAAEFTENVIHTYAYSGSYHTSLIATSTNGCIDTTFRTVVIDSIYSVFIPNAFSPNGDGNHDVFLIKNIEFFPKAVLEVYNQWGELVYKSDPGYTTPWDGTRNGKALSVSSYYYVLNINKDGHKPLNGYITLIR